jgi:FMN phosphatase YigB (HAD superfamily)
MVGDSVRQDVEGALAVGMRAILVDRERRIDHPRQHELASAGVPVIHSLSEITNWVIE